MDPAFADIIAFLVVLCNPTWKNKMQTKNSHKSKKNTVCARYRHARMLGHALSHRGQDKRRKKKNRNSTYFLPSDFSKVLFKLLLFQNSIHSH
jgi:hypothetical protein